MRRKLALHRLLNRGISQVGRLWYVRLHPIVLQQALCSGLKLWEKKILVEYDSWSVNSVQEHLRTR